MSGEGMRRGFGVGGAGVKEGGGAAGGAGETAVRVRWRRALTDFKSSAKSLCSCDWPKFVAQVSTKT